MKILSVTLARAIWVIDMDRTNPKGRSLVDAFRGVVERYKFSKYPAHLLDYGEGGGLSFLSGTFVKDGLDLRVGLTIFNNGIQADTLSSTDDAEALLQDMRQFMAEKFNFVIDEDLITTKAYQSRLDVQMDRDVSSINPALQPIADYLSDKSLAIDGKKRKFSIGGFQTFPADIGAKSAPQIFRFERKYGEPFEKNIYFAQAQLRTSEHLELLEKLESLLRA